MDYINLNTIHKIETDMIAEIDRVCRKENIHYFLWYGTLLGAVRHSGPIPWDTDVDVAIYYKDLDRLLDALHRYLNPKYYVSYALIDKKSSSPHPEIYARGVDERVVHLDICPLFGMPSDPEERRQHWAEIKKYIWKIYYKRFPYIGTHDMRGLKISIKRMIHYGKCVVYYPFLGKTSNIINKLRMLYEKYDFDNSEYITDAEVSSTEKAITLRRYIGNEIEHEYDEHMFYIPEEYDELLRTSYGDYMTPIHREEDILRAKINKKEFVKFFSDI